MGVRGVADGSAEGRLGPGLVAQDEGRVDLVRLEEHELSEGATAAQRSPHKESQPEAWHSSKTSALGRTSRQCSTLPRILLQSSM
eukprot:CAMPEP_0115146868 /NCGR_PEP_ID=MMETSP0227-20121206/62962_1 /TAXON_ID=89957 /ORGANISM="Polarella glacialis, Strain CCMP 1383" /LENGTH=84 /DNA_ID=CAMNT_0002556649 /DNA_START=393 /DNA_END=648 /DNA_ORIENTATION=+